MNLYLPFQSFLHLRSLYQSLNDKLFLVDFSLARRELKASRYMMAGRKLPYFRADYRPYNENGTHLNVIYMLMGAIFHYIAGNKMWNSPDYNSQMSELCQNDQRRGRTIFGPPTHLRNLVRFGFLDMNLRIPHLLEHCL